MVSFLRFLRTRFGDSQGCTDRKSSEGRYKPVRLKSYKLASGSGAIAAMLAFLFALFAGAPRANAAPDPANRSYSSPHLFAQFSIADFDGDHRPDFATVQDGRGDSQNTLYWIAFRLSSGPRRSMDISAPSGGLQIASMDVNSDGFPDVVVTTLWTGHPVAILLNDGSGHFRLSSPSVFPEVFSAQNDFWGFHPACLRDASAVLPSISRSSQPRKAAGCCFLRTGKRLSGRQETGGLPFFLIAVFSGRAPPLPVYST